MKKSTTKAVAVACRPSGVSSRAGVASAASRSMDARASFAVLGAVAAGLISDIKLVGRDSPLTNLRMLKILCAHVDGFPMRLQSDRRKCPRQPVEEMLPVDYKARLMLDASGGDFSCDAEAGSRGFSRTERRSAVEDAFVC